MGEKNGRRLTIAGVLGAAVISAFLLTPMIDRVGRIDNLWLDAAIVIVPTAVLTATGYRYYGLLRSLAVALVVMTLTCVITWVVALFTLAAALAESPTALAVGVLLHAAPAACVVIFALLAMRMVWMRSRSVAHMQQ